MKNIHLQVLNIKAVSGCCVVGPAIQNAISYMRKEAGRLILLIISFFSLIREVHVSWDCLLPIFSFFLCLFVVRALVCNEKPCILSYYELKARKEVTWWGSDFFPLYSIDDDNKKLGKVGEPSGLRTTGESFLATRVILHIRIISCVHYFQLLSFIKSKSLHLQTWHNNTSPPTD